MPYALKRQRLCNERRGRGEPLLLITGFAVRATVFEPVRPSLSLMLDWLRRRGPIAAGCCARRRRGPREPVTPALGLPVGALRTTASLFALRHNSRARSDSNDGGNHVASN